MQDAGDGHHGLDVLRHALDHDLVRNAVFSHPVGHEADGHMSLAKLLRVAPGSRHARHRQGPGDIVGFGPRLWRILLALEQSLTQAFVILSIRPAREFTRDSRRHDPRDRTHKCELHAGIGIPCRARLRSSDLGDLVLIEVGRREVDHVVA